MYPAGTLGLSSFSKREGDALFGLLESWQEYGLPSGFLDYGVRPMMNKYSGDVFLTNSRHQIVKVHKSGMLELYYFCPVCNHGGFLDEMTDGGHGASPGCGAYLRTIGVMEEA